MVYETRYSDSLTHYDIKGQKWGVRRYQNPDGTLTAKGKARKIKSLYKEKGANRYMTRRHAYYIEDEDRRADKVNAAIDRLNKNEYSPKQRKKLAKDYSIAINGIKKLSADTKARALMEMDYYYSTDKKIQKLAARKQNERTRAKIDKLITNRSLMGLAINNLASDSRLSKYEATTKKLIDKMGADSRLVYRTKERLLGTTGGDIGYDVYGTKYVIKPSTKSRGNSKRYNDPKNKREYNEHITKHIYMYY